MARAGLLVVSRHALAPGEFGADVVERQAGVGEQDDQVEHQVRRLGDDRGVVARHRGDHGLDRFLAELLRDLGRGPRRTGWRCRR